MIATSRGDYSSLAQSLGVHFFQDADDFAEEHPEVVILASSILSTEAVLDSLPVQRLKRSTLFVDVLSVKEFPKQLFLSKLPAQVGCFLYAPLLPSPPCLPLLPGPLPHHPQPHSNSPFFTHTLPPPTFPPTAPRPLPMPSALYATVSPY